MIALLSNLMILSYETIIFHEKRSNFVNCDHEFMTLEFNIFLSSSFTRSHQYSCLTISK
jgi:hypothetical protein